MKKVREFLNNTINNSHVFYENSWIEGRHRVYSLVKKVDNELDDLRRIFKY